MVSCCIFPTKNYDPSIHDPANKYNRLLNLTTKLRMEKVKPRTDKRPIKYEGCLMTVMCILIQYWILVNVHSWEIPNAVPRGQGIGLAYQGQMRITFTHVHNHKKLNCD